MLFELQAKNRKKSTGEFFVKLEERQFGAVLGLLDSKPQSKIFFKGFHFFNFQGS